VRTIFSAVSSSIEGFCSCLRVVRQALEQLRVDLHREDVHRHRDQHRAGAAALGQLEGLLEDLGEQVGRSTRQTRLTKGR
jgi:hypothetical protein